MFLISNRLYLNLYRTHVSYDGTHSIGGFKVLNREDMEHIYRAAR